MALLLFNFSVSAPLLADEEPEVIKVLRAISPTESVVVCIVAISDWGDSQDNVKSKWFPLVREHSPLVPVMIIMNMRGSNDSVSHGLEDSAVNCFSDFVEQHKVRQSTYLASKRL